MLNHYLKLLNNKEKDIEKIRDYLKESSLSSLLNIFSEDSLVKGKLSWYLGNTQELLQAIIEKMQKEVMIGNFYIDKDKSVSNSRLLLIRHSKFKKVFAYMNLQSRTIDRVSSYKKYLFNLFQHIQEQEKIIERDFHLIEKYEEELEKYKKTSRLSLKMKGVSPTDFEKMESKIELLKEDLNSNKEHLEYLKRRCTELKEYESNFIDELKQLSLNMKKIGFHLENKDLSEQKIYHIFHKEMDNSHYFGETSFSKNHTAIFNQEDYEVETVLKESEIMSLKTFTEEDLKHLAKLSILNDVFIDVEMQKEEDEWLVKINHADGYFVLKQNGQLLIKGEKLTLFDLIMDSNIFNFFYQSHTA